jgi:hypothetical protein
MGRPNAATGCAARGPRAALSGVKDFPLYSDLVGQYGMPHTWLVMGLAHFPFACFLSVSKISKFLETEQILNWNKFQNWNKI